MTSFDHLVDGFIHDSLSPEELTEFLALLDSREKVLAQQIDQDLRSNRFAGGTTMEQRARMLEDVMSRAAVRVMPSRRIIVMRRIAVAASILLVMASVLYFVLPKRSEQPGIAQTTDVAAPDKNRASITLADGRVIYLDSLQAGTIATQNAVIVTKDPKGNIIYSNIRGTANNQPISFNTLSNPRGSNVIDMTLSDGSHVWLNAGSSVRYPIAFTGIERNVTITGEAYFKVVHNHKMPFSVEANGVKIEDLGTEFNVNAYRDEAAVKTTLIKGIIKVGAVTLKPGQQTLNETLNGDVDIDEVIAWKNGLFQFNKTDTRTVMRQLEKWYDIDVRYAGGVPDHQFIGQMDRDWSLVKVLNILAKSGLKFNIEDKILTIQ